MLSEIDGKKQIAGLQVADQSEDFYFFVVPIGEYDILALEDLNANLKNDEGEYFGHFGRPDQIAIDSLISRDDLHIEVARTSGYPEGLPTDSTKVPIASSVKNEATGTIITLDDEKFSQEMAEPGFWQPMAFLKKVGSGIYFLEPFSPTKIPVLFVHGASGSPRHFQFLAERIDRNRFQPWFYHYPSGYSLEKVRRFLNRLVTILHEEYRFKQLYATAHSVGGLVSGAFIYQNVYEDRNSYITLFVSISSPFGGLEVAQEGVESAPVAIPSWHDVVPGSPFIEMILAPS